MGLLSLWSLVLAQTPDSLPTELYHPRQGDVNHPYRDRLCELVSLDPELRLRAAWLLPQVAVRGEKLSLAAGRAFDLHYKLDGVALWDIQTGERTIHLPQTLLESGELVRLEGNLIPSVELASRGRLSGWHAEAKGLSPFFLDPAHEGDAALFFSIPLGRKLNVAFDGEATLWNERPEANLALPHRGIASYTAVARAALEPREGMLVRATLLEHSEQRDYFDPAWAFNHSSAPSAYNLVDLLIFDYRYTKGVLDLDMTLSGYNGSLWYGGRKPADLALLNPFSLQDSITPPALLDTRNPFGVAGLFYSQGAHPAQIYRSSIADRALVKLYLFLDEVNQLRGRLGYKGSNVYAEHEAWYAGRENTTEFQYTPRLGEFYLGDRLLLERFWVEPGMGLLYFEQETADSAGRDSSTVRLAMLPRLEAKGVLKGVLLDAGSELGGALPPLAFFYEQRGEAGIADWGIPSIPDSLLLVPRLDPGFERAWLGWVDAQKDWGHGLRTSFCGFFRLGYHLLESGLNPPKDSKDTTAGVFLGARSQSFGVSPIVEYRSGWLDLRASYTLSSSRATSAGLYEDYEDLLAGDPMRGTMRPTPLDSRHKFTLEPRFSTPGSMHLLLRDWFIAPCFALMSGFPDEASDGLLPWWAWAEIGAGRVVEIKGLRAELRVELLNPFAWEGPIIGELPPARLPTEAEFPNRVRLGDARYHPSRDANHDGYITAREEVQAYRRAREFYEASSASPLPGRSLEIKLSVKF